MISPRPFALLGLLTIPVIFDLLVYRIHEEQLMSILREWRAEIRRETSAAYVEYVRDTGIAEYRRTPGNLGAGVAVRAIDEPRSKIVTLRWRPGQDSFD